MATTLEIDVTGRWDAVTLLRRLASCHAHLIQLGVIDDRWLVRAVMPGVHCEGIVDALDVVNRWHRERALESVYVCVSPCSAPTRRDLRGLRSHARV